MENTTTNNIPNEQNIAAEPVDTHVPDSDTVQANTHPAAPSEPHLHNVARPENAPVNNSAFYNNYTRQPGTIAYNVPAYTPAAQQPIYKNTSQAPAQSPAAIYNNTRAGGSAPQYHYGNPTAPGIIDNEYYRQQQLKAQQNKKDVKTIRTLGNIAGLAIIICFLRSIFMSSLIPFIPFAMDIYNAGTGGLFLINMFYSVFGVGLVFLVLHFILKGPKDRTTGEKKYESSISLGAPKKPFKSLLLIFIGFGGCMIANFVISYLFAFLESFGFDSGYMDTENPAGILETIVMFLGIAVIPPLIEEFAMRGVLVSSMQKYGNAFAILATAFVFGLFHGNFTQIPFAFICGLFFAYVTIATKSLWPAIIIHAMNNGLSCISTVLTQHFDENASNIFFYVAALGGIALGVISLVIYLIAYKKDFVLKNPGRIPHFSLAKKFRKFLSAPAMIIAMVLYVGQAFVLAVASSFM